MKQRLYNTPDEVFESLHAQERAIAFYLRELVMDTLIGCKEKLNFGAPFYFRNRRICYIWPGSIPWGKSTFEGVTIGFCYGNELMDTDWLDKGKRKEVFSKTFKKTDEIDADILKVLLLEALEIDQRKPSKSAGTI